MTGVLFAKDDDFYQQYSRLYETHAPGLIFYARKFVDNQSAEDIVHDVFLKLLNESSFVIIDKTIFNYFFQAVRNSCLNYLKRQTVHNEYIAKAIIELKIEEINFTGPDHILIDREQLDLIYNEINRLPEKCREVFMMAYIEDKKNPEIAQQLDISVRTVESHLYKALKILQSKLSHVSFALWAGIFPHI